MIIYSALINCFSQFSFALVNPDISPLLHTFNIPYNICKSSFSHKSSLFIFRCWPSKHKYICEHLKMYLLPSFQPFSLPWSLHIMVIALLWKYRSLCSSAHPSPYKSTGSLAAFIVVSFLIIAHVTLIYSILLMSLTWSKIGKVVNITWLSAWLPMKPKLLNCSLHLGEIDQIKGNCKLLLPNYTKKDGMYI